ncbi:MAG: MGMT family protein [Chitinophagaceae bacterium]|nr:MGMT family protein [Chitinophagaceae bacterium]
MAKRIIKHTITARKPVPAKKEAPKDTIQAYHFFTDVYDVVRQIPKGRVTSYGAIAAYLGTKLSARMVGWAMNAAHTASPKVPAQRVVNRNGMLTGKHHFESPDAMEALLKKDGVAVKNDTVVDFKERFWDPSIALAL